MSEVSTYDIIVIAAKRAASYPAFKKTAEIHPGLKEVCETVKAAGHKGLKEFFKSVRKPQTND